VRVLNSQAELFVECRDIIKEGLHVSNSAKIPRELMLPFR
jgi:hypothetical protein